MPSLGRFSTRHQQSLTRMTYLDNTSQERGYDGLKTDRSQCCTHVISVGRQYKASGKTRTQGGIGDKLYKNHLFRWRGIRCCIFRRRCCGVTSLGELLELSHVTIQFLYRDQVQAKRRETILTALFGSNCKPRDIDSMASSS